MVDKFSGMKTLLGITGSYNDVEKAYYKTLSGGGGNGGTVAEGALVDLNSNAGVETALGRVTAIRNQGTGGAAYDLDTVVGTAANLKSVPQNSLLLTGEIGTFVNTVDSPETSITGDMDVQWFGQMFDYTPATNMVLTSKWGGNGFKTFVLQINSTGVLQILHSTDGSTEVSTVSTAPVPTTNGDDAGFRFTLDVDNGAGGADVTFFTSTDGVAWTQLGSVVVIAGPITLFDSTSPTEIGSAIQGTANPHSGITYSVKVYDVIDGTTPVINFVPTTTASAKGKETLLLITGDGSIVDESEFPNTVTLGGDVQTSSGIVKFGTTSILFDGTGDYLLCADSPEWAYGTDDFAIELWAYTAASGGATTQTLVAQRNSGDGTNLFLWRIVDRTIGFIAISGGATVTNIASTIQMPLSSWTHLALERNNGQCKIYVNGVSSDTVTANTTLAMPDVVQPLIIGIGWSAGAGAFVDHPFIGNMADIIFVRGEALHKGDFSVPTAQATIPVESGTALTSVDGLRYRLFGNAVTSSTGSMESLGGVSIEPAVAPATLTTPITMFIAAKVKEVNGIKQTLISGKTDEANSIEIGISADGNFIADAGNILTAGPADTDLHVFTVRQNGDGTSTFTVSDVGTVTGDLGTEGLNYGTLFADVAGGETAKGSQSRVLIFDSALTDTEVTDVQSFLLNPAGGGIDLTNYTGSLNDLKRVVFESLGFDGSIQDMESEYLESLGYTGTLDDMIQAFWEAQ